MRRWLGASVSTVMATPRAAMVACAKALAATTRLVRGWVQTALEWHRRRMVTDPAYPAALLAIGKTVLRIAIPSAPVAVALTTVLAELLMGPRHPWLDDDPWDELE